MIIPAGCTIPEKITQILVGLSDGNLTSINPSSISKCSSIVDSNIDASLFVVVLRELNY